MYGHKEEECWNKLSTRLLQTVFVSNVKCHSSDNRKWKTILAQFFVIVLFFSLREERLSEKAEELLVKEYLTYLDQAFEFERLGSRIAIASNWGHYNALYWFASVFLLKWWNVSIFCWMDFSSYKFLWATRICSQFTG